MNDRHLDILFFVSIGELHESLMQKVPTQITGYRVIYQPRLNGNVNRRGKDLCLQIILNVIVLYRIVKWEKHD